MYSVVLKPLARVKRGAARESSPCADVEVAGSCRAITPVEPRARAHRCSATADEAGGAGTLCVVLGTRGAVWRLKGCGRRRLGRFRVWLGGNRVRIRLGRNCSIGFLLV